MITVMVGSYFLVASTYSYFIIGAAYIVTAITTYQLFQYIDKTNKKLIKFLNAIQYSDFSLRFPINDNLSDSFSNLNASFNNVIGVFKKERLEKIEHLHYLNTIVNHVNMGLIAFQGEGQIEIFNKRAKLLLNIFSLKNIKDIAPINDKLYQILTTLSAGESATLSIDDKNKLAIFATTLKLSNRNIKIFAIQNIYKELLSKEVESWQKLASVLRHEIMNSITPINSINSTLLTVVNEDFKTSSDDENYRVNKESYDDLVEGLVTINERTKSLVDFVNGYRDYTSIPKPVYQKIVLEELMDRIHSLMKNELRLHKLQFECISEHSDQIVILGDSNLLEMVIINLIKNSIDACTHTSNPKVILAYGYDDSDYPFISVSDNGMGITPEALEKIFIPFYTTKETGTGIGLSLSRQIVEMHNGSLTVHSIPNDQTTFKVQFYKN